MNLKEVKNWFGERGYVGFDPETKIKHKTITYKDEPYLFIVGVDDYEDEVEVYALNSMCYEAIDGWKVENFDWSKKSLTNKLDNLYQNELI